MTHHLHKTWLRIMAVGVASFAPVFFLGSLSCCTGPARLTLDILDWPLDGAQAFASQDIRFLSALAGGFLLGWGVLIWQLATHVYDLAPDRVRKAALTGVLAWFLLDSAGSVASGAAPNVLFNTILLIALVGPLWRAVPEHAPHMA